MFCEDVIWVIFLPSNYNYKIVFGLVWGDIKNIFIYQGQQSPKYTIDWMRINIKLRNQVKTYIIYSDNW